MTNQVAKCCSHGLFILFGGADAHDFIDGPDEYLPVTNLPSPSGLLDGAHGALQDIVGHNQLQLELGHKINRVRAASIDFGPAFLAAKPFDLADGHALDAQFRQFFFDRVELMRLDDGFYHLHGRLRALRTEAATFQGGELRPARRVLLFRSALARRPRSPLDAGFLCPWP